ncbi:MAG: VOC family protein [Deltaproteobacteria bacterium]|nr:VOC family protein [Deltaproteobacteria bacterium]
MFCDGRFGPIKQWGFLVKDLDRAMACWVDQLGVGPWWASATFPSRRAFGARRAR